MSEYLNLCTQARDKNLFPEVVTSRKVRRLSPGGNDTYREVSELRLTNSHHMTISKERVRGIDDLDRAARVMLQLFS